MLTFTVHEPPRPPADRIDRAESLVFIKDGFSWAAALFAPIWLLVHRLWWPLLGYVVLSVPFELVRWGITSTRVGSRWRVLRLHLLIGFEADTLRRWALDQAAGAPWARSRAATPPNASAASTRSGCPTQPLIAPASGPRPLGRRAGSQDPDHRLPAGSPLLKPPPCSALSSSTTVPATCTRRPRPSSGRRVRARPTSALR